MNIDEMKRRAEAWDNCEQSAPIRAADVLTLLAERERLAEEYDGILNALDVDGAPQMAVGQVLQFQMLNETDGRIGVTAKMRFAWSYPAARAAFDRARVGEFVTLVLDAPSAVRAVYAERARLDALLAALRSVDERELPEHVAAALRAIGTPATPPNEKPVLSGETEQAFIDHAREEGLAYASENYRVDDPALRRLVDAYNDAGRALSRAIGL